MFFHYMKMKLFRNQEKYLVFLKACFELFCDRNLLLYMKKNLGSLSTE
jgi:hypothetical protein